MCQIMMLPESDPLDLSPATRRMIDGDAAPGPVRWWVVVLWILALLPGLALWAALWWGLVRLVDAIYHALY